MGKTVAFFGLPIAFFLILLYNDKKRNKWRFYTWAKDKQEARQELRLLN